PGRPGGRPGSGPGGLRRPGGRAGLGGGRGARRRIRRPCPRRHRGRDGADGRPRHHLRGGAVTVATLPTSGPTGPRAGRPRAARALPRSGWALLAGALVAMQVAHVVVRPDGWVLEWRWA